MNEKKSYRVKVSYGEDDLLDCILQIVRIKLAEHFA